MAERKDSKPDFEINPKAGRVSYAFWERGVYTFQQAGKYLRTVMFQRPQNPGNILAPLEEDCGTCRHKHAILGVLARENGQTEYETVVELYKTETEEYHGLSKDEFPYIPSSHAVIYYKPNDAGKAQRLDYTRPQPPPKEPEILYVVPVTPEQLVRWKAIIQKAYMKRWLEENEYKISFEELWEEREKRMERRLRLT